MTRPRKIAITAAAVLGLLLVGFVWLRLAAVPVRELQYAGTWMQSERGRTAEITADSAINRMIHQAQRDYFIAPLPHRRAPLVYIRTETVPPNDIYLIFWLTDYHDIVVYRGTREDGRLLWKALWAQ